MNAVIRPIRPDDNPLIAKAFSLLSDETRTRRFLGPKPRLTQSELRYFTEVDGHDHVALIAVEPEHPERVMAVARFVRDPARPDTAEFAIVVGDAYQRQGLGRTLARRLVAEARARDIRRFTAWTLSDNVGAQRLIRSMSEHLTYVPRGGGARELVVELAA
ncbi:MAG: GNAT family N-acetyltransferase [Actinomycetota bacterium]|nr:GNAT family N-acetyltransferase [Actinomycetota bacterium]